MKNVEVNGWGVAASLILIAIAVVLSWRERLGIGRTILWASTRALAQLLVVGFGLGLVLADDAPLTWSFLWVVAMVLVGAVTVASRVRELPRLFWLALAALASSQVICLAVVFGFDIFPLEPRAVVPAAGMILGNVIGATVLAARRTLNEIREHVRTIEVRLALGDSGSEAVRPHLTEALRTSVTPQIESTKVVGLIALPGTMTGLLLAGVDPLDAVLAQAVVMFLILGSVAITSVWVGRGVARSLVTPDQRLVLPTTGRVS